MIVDVPALQLRNVCHVILHVRARRYIKDPDVVAEALARVWPLLSAAVEHAAGAPFQAPAPVGAITSVPIQKPAPV